MLQINFGGKKLKLNTFIENWEETSEKNKQFFLSLKEYLEKKEHVKLNFIARKQITYSLRAVHILKTNKPFVMIDVIEDSPRWLSICFYEKMIADHKEMGNLVPNGLLGENAICFDIEEYDDGVLNYLKELLNEAYQKALL